MWLGAGITIYIAMTLKHTHKWLAIIGILLITSACATRPPAHDLGAVAEYERINDPLEPFNRVVFKANLIGDKLILRPMIKTYIKVMPKPVKDGVSNVVANLLEPWSLINHALQGKPDSASESLARFVINSTIGILGIFDVATSMGLEEEKEDLGQTLAVWGMDEGVYVMLPFFGPSSVRDTIGLTGEFFADPMGIAIDKMNVGDDIFLGIDGGSYIHFAVEAFDKRVRYDEGFDEMYEAEDPYVLARSAYRQKRTFDISDGAIDTSEEEEDIFGEEFDDE